MPRFCHVVIAGALGLLLAAPAAGRAQQLQPGSRIRVNRPCNPGEFCPSVTGHYLATSGSVLTLREGADGERKVELLPGSSIDVFRGSRSHALLGLGIGAGLGILGGVLLTDDCVEEASQSPIAGICGANLIVAVPVGALLGLLVGSMARTERWERMTDPLP